MKTAEFEKSRWEDIVFENRNKAYGAYVIRNIYGKHVLLASLITTMTLDLFWHFLQSLIISKMRSRRKMFP